MPTNTLTDAQCKRAEPGPKPLKLFDGHGLHLFITPAGGKRWRMAYRLDGKQQTATFGPYPRVSLAEARKARDDLLRTLALGERPKTRQRGASSFREASEKYWGARKDVTDDYRANALRGLEMHLWPKLGSVPVDRISRDMLLDELRRMDAAGKHVYVRRVRIWAGQVFDWAVEHGDATNNPAASIRPEKAFGKKTVESFAALKLTEVPDLMERLSFEKDLQSVLMCKLLALTWVRTKEARFMRWDELDGAEWLIEAGTMKKRREHVVPLSSQALGIVERLRARRVGDYVFPAEHRPDRTMSENAVLALLARIGYKGRMTGHGFRSVGSTWAHKNEFKSEAIEMQLSHAPENKVASVYNRYAYLEVRRRMLQQWADWLLPAPPT